MKMYYIYCIFGGWMTGIVLYIIYTISIGKKAIKYSTLNNRIKKGKQIDKHILNDINNNNKLF